MDLTTRNNAKRSANTREVLMASTRRRRFARQAAASQPHPTQTCRPRRCCPTGSTRGGFASTQLDTAVGPYPEVAAWSADTEQQEAEWIAQLVCDLHGRGIPYRDVAVLVRTRAAYGALMSQFAVFN